MGKLIDDKIVDFFSKYRKKEFKKGEIIINSEVVPKGIYYIDKGYVREYSTSSQGFELTINIFKPKTFFPLAWAISGITNHYYYESFTNTTLIKAPKEDVLKYIKKDNEILYDITKRVFKGLNTTIVRMQYIAQENAYIKVANVLLLASKRFGEKVGPYSYNIRLKLTHQDIANLAGLTRETTSIQVKNLERKGYIERHKARYMIKDIRKLKKESLIAGNKVLR